MNRRVRRASVSVAACRSVLQETDGPECRLRSHRSPHGLTLLEVLVASVMVGLLAAVVFASLRTAFRARNRALGISDQIRSAMLALEWIGRDLTCALPPGGLLTGSFVSTDETDASAYPSDTLAFYLADRSPQPREGWGDIHQVGFGLVGAEEKESPQIPGYNLVRRRMPGYAPLAPVTPVAEEEVLCRNVRSFNLRFFDGLAWVDQWDSSAYDGALPLAVEVQLELSWTDPQTGRQQTYTAARIFRLPAGRAVASEEEEAPAP